MSEPIAAEEMTAILDGSPYRRTDMGIIADYIRAVSPLVGPRCPACGHFLIAQHDRKYPTPRHQDDYFSCGPCAEGLQRGVSRCEITVTELRAHPHISNALGLEVA